MLNLLRLGVCLQKKRRLGEARLLEPFSTFSFCYWKRVMYISNTHLTSLCNAISLIESCVISFLENLNLSYYFTVLFWGFFTIFSVSDKLVLLIAFHVACTS